MYINNIHIFLNVFTGRIWVPLHKTLVENVRIVMGKERNWMEEQIKANMEGWKESQLRLLEQEEMEDPNKPKKKNEEKNGKKNKKWEEKQSESCH